MRCAAERARAGTEGLVGDPAVAVQAEWAVSFIAAAVSIN